jgi:urease accessory protein
VPAELRGASQKLGVRFVKAASALLPEKAVNVDMGSDSGGDANVGGASFFHRYARAAGRNLCTQPVAYGVFCASVGIALDDALRTFLYAQTSAMVVNFVKTVPLSQTSGQRILAGCHDIFGRVMQKLGTLGERDLFRAYPGHEIRAMQHEKLYSRMYMS